jgi:hypothetical protein
MKLRCAGIASLILAGILYTGCLLPVEAQNTTCSDRPITDSSNACANTRFVQNVVQAAAQVGVSVKTCGAKGDGVTDDTAAINTCVASATASGKATFFPGGTYIISSLTTLPAGASLVCEDYQGTIIKTNSATADVIPVNSGNVSITNCQLQSSVVRSAGAYIALGASGGAFNARQLLLQAPFIGFSIANGFADAYIDDVRIQNTVASTGTSFLIDGGVALRLNSILATGSTAPAAHVKINNVGDITILDSHLLGAINNMTLSPSNGQSVVSIKTIGTWFDQATQFNIVFVPTGTGAILRSSFIDGWAAQAAVANVSMACAGATSCNGIDFSNFDVFASGYGISAIGANISNIQINGGKFAGATVTALNFDNVQGVQILGAKIGSVAAYPVNLVGLTLSGTTDNVMVTANNFVGSTTPVTNTASGTSISFGPNIGYNPVSFPTGIIQGDTLYASATNGVLSRLPKDTNATRAWCNTGTNNNPAWCQLPISNGISGLGTGVATFLGTPSSANLRSAVTDETGTGALVFADGPTFNGVVSLAYTIPPAGAGQTFGFNGAVTRQTGGTGGDSAFGFNYAFTDNGSTNPLTTAPFRVVSTYNNAANTSAFNSNFDSTLQTTANLTAAKGYVSNMTAFAGTIGTYYGFYAGAPASGGGTITNKFAFYAEANAGPISQNDTTDSTTTTTGAVQIAGGMGIAKAIYGGAEIATGIFTVTGLPTCNAARKAARAFVSDNATALAFAAVITTGGAIQTPVYCDGTVWRQG